MLGKFSNYSAIVVIVLPVTNTKKTKCMVFSKNMNILRPFQESFDSNLEPCIIHFKFCP